VILPLLLPPATAVPGGGSGLQMYGDSAYGSGAARAASRDRATETSLPNYRATEIQSGERPGVYGAASRRAVIAGRP